VEAGLPPGEQLQRRDATIREEITPRKLVRDRFREGGCARVPTDSIVFPLLKGDVPVSLPVQQY